MIWVRVRWNPDAALPFSCSRLANRILSCIPMLTDDKTSTVLPRVPGFQVQHRIASVYPNDAHPLPTVPADAEEHSPDGCQFASKCASPILRDIKSALYPLGTPGTDIASRKLCGRSLHQRQFICQDIQNQRPNSFPIGPQQEEPPLK
jgi:hypothetical protein